MQTTITCTHTHDDDILTHRGSINALTYVCCYSFYRVTQLC